jgi:hypothetical protein
MRVGVEPLHWAVSDIATIVQQAGVENNGLTLSLAVAPPSNDTFAPPLMSYYENKSAKAVEMVFWWNVCLLALDSQGQLIHPSPGPLRPCGAMENKQQIAPGQRFERSQFFQCTQPGVVQMLLLFHALLLMRCQSW